MKTSNPDRPIPHKKSICSVYSDSEQLVMQIKTAHDKQPDPNHIHFQFDDDLSGTTRGTMMRIIAETMKVERIVMPDAANSAGEPTSASRSKRNTP